MKKKIFSGIAVLAFAAIVGLNVKMNASDNQVNNLALANVEALGCEGGKSCGYSNHGPTADRFWSNTTYSKNENQSGCSYKNNELYFD